MTVSSGVLLDFCPGPEPGTHPAPEWLPVPVSHCQHVHVPVDVRRSTLHNFWTPAPTREGSLRRAAWLLVAGTALTGISYGFAFMLELVEHWAVFNSGLERLVQ